MNNKTTKKVKFSPGVWEQTKVPSIFSKEICVRNKSGMIAILPSRFITTDKTNGLKKSLNNIGQRPSLSRTLRKCFGYWFKEPTKPGNNIYSTSSRILSDKGLHLEIGQSVKR